MAVLFFAVVVVDGIVDGESSMKILLATDGSDFSNYAAEKVCDLAVSHAKVRVVAAYEPPESTAVGNFVGTPEFYQELMDGLKSSAEAAAQTCRDIIQRRCPQLQVEIDVRIGRAEEAILGSADDWKADLIVVGSHGRGFWDRSLLGSVTNALVHHAHCPVLVVRRKPEQ